MSYRCYEDIKTQDVAWKAALSAVDERAEELEALFSDPPGEVLFVSCGSPYYIGQSNAALWKERTHLRAAAIPSSEIMLFPDIHLGSDESPVMLTASRSGETTETVEATKRFAEKHPGRTVLVGCRGGSSMEQLADLAIMMPEAYEDVVPQTRSFGSMYLAVQYLVALVSGDEALRDELRSLPELLPDLIDRWEPSLQDVAQDDWDSAVFLGGGPLHGVSNEGSLKLTEMALDFAISYHSLEVRHGPRSTIDEKTLVVGLGSHRGAVQEQRVLAELAEQSPHVLACTPAGDWKLGESARQISLEHEITEHALGILYAPLLQLLAYHRAVYKNVNPDQSRNLTGYVELSNDG